MLTVSKCNITFQSTHTKIKKIKKIKNIRLQR